MLIDTSMVKRLGISPDALYRYCVSEILDAGVQGKTYEEKALEMIENKDILPNEMAYLIVAGINYLMLLIDAEDQIRKENKCEHTLV